MPDRPPRAPGGRRWGGATLVIVLLFAVVAAETWLLVKQRAAATEVSARSAGMLSGFLKGDTLAHGGRRGVAIRLRDVRFKWSEKVYIDARDMSVRAVSENPDGVVDFDSLHAFHLEIERSVVAIRPDVLEGMFNESVFNYPGSRLRQLKVKLGKDDSGRDAVVLSGLLDMGLWIPFKMTTRLSVDTVTNTLVIQVDNVKAFKILPVTKLLRWTPLHLERLVSVPPNKSLRVDGNRLMLKPLALFPPPRISGKMVAVELDSNVIRLSFAGSAVRAPGSREPHYVYLSGGTSRFGRFQMQDTDVLIVDADTTDTFGFSLMHYAEMIPRSRVRMPDMRSARIVMPDR